MSRPSLRPSRARLPALLAALLAAAPAAAAPARPAAADRVAILEFQGPGTAPELLRTATDGVRAAALDPAARRGFEVMTRETTALILEQMGGQCLEGQCEIELARTVGASVVLTGEIRKVEGALFADLKLHGTDKGTLLAAERVRTRDAVALLDELQGATERLLEAGLARLGAQRRGERPGFWSRFRSPGWTVGTLLDSQWFVAASDPYLESTNASGAHGALRVGWGPVGLQLGAWFPGTLPAFGVDLFRDTGVRLRQGGAWTLTWLVPDLELRVVPSIDLPRRGFVAADTGRALFLSGSLTGLAAGWRGVVVSVRGPTVSYLTLSSSGSPAATGEGLTLGVAAYAGYAF